jgi:hypothetical protein
MNFATHQARLCSIHLCRQKFRSARCQTMTFASAVICSVTAMVITALMITALLAGATQSQKTSSSTLKNPLSERHRVKVGMVIMTGGNVGSGISSSISGTSANHGGDSGGIASTGGVGGGGGNGDLTSVAPDTGGHCNHPSADMRHTDGAPPRQVSGYPPPFQARRGGCIVQWQHGVVPTPNRARYILDVERRGPGADDDEGPGRLP